MPFRHRSNNRVLPANARSVDVARQAINQLTPVQQRKYDNAFAVQGLECLVYNRLYQGQPCSCQANRKTFTSLLKEDGKMKSGHMNELLTGGLEFTVNDFGSRMKGRDDLRSIRGIKELSRSDQRYGELTDESDHEPPMMNGGDLDSPYVDIADVDGEFDNGSHGQKNLDDIVEVFDPDALDISSTKCGCCFGTGFVGGYSVLYGIRKVIAPASPEVYSVDGTIEVNQTPHAFRATSVKFDIVFPLGFMFLDAFKFWNNVDQVAPSSVLIDNLLYTTALVPPLCDGRTHRVEVQFEDFTYFTHFEFQIGVSNRTALIEFPKLNSTTDLSRLDLTGDVQINASPSIPKLQTRDVLVESTYGKTFILGDTTLWNDRDRNVHGWDGSARVVQPNELLSTLPRRRKLNQRSTSMVRDNLNGIRRT